MFRISSLWRLSLVSVVAVLVAVPSAMAAGVLPSATVCASGCDATTIQGGVNAVRAGGTVTVAAGTYAEQVDVTSNITITGAGAGSTIIQAPPSMTTNAASYHAVVTVRNGATANISKVTVDGAYYGGSNFDGVQFYDASGTLSDAAVTRVRDNPLASLLAGYAVHALDDNASAQSVTVARSVISDYGKSGVRFEGAGVTGTVDADTITGIGPNTSIAQNGVVFLPGAGGSVTGSTITGNECDVDNGPPNVCGADLVNDILSYGVLLYSSNDVTISSNTISGNDAAMYLETEGHTATVTQNSLSGNRWHNVVANGGAFDVRNNTISGSGTGFAALTYDGTDPGDEPQGSFTGNTVSGTSTAGVWIGPTPAGSPDPVVAAHANRLPGSGVGVANGTSTALDATGNWWGCNAGANQAGCSTTSGPVATGLPLQLTLVPSPATIAPNGTSTLTASLGNSQFPATSIAFAKAAGDGSVAPAGATTTSGAAASVYTAGPSLGTADLTATLDNQTVHATVTKAVAAPRDPWSPFLVLLRMGEKLGQPHLGSGSASFTDNVAEPGHLLYGLDISFYRGGTRSASAAATPKPIHIGSTSRDVKSAGPIKVTIPIGAKGRKFLKKHKNARLVVRTYFVTATEQTHLYTGRTLSVKGHGG